MLYNQYFLNTLTTYEVLNEIRMKCKIHSGLKNSLMNLNVDQIQKSSQT